MVKKIPQGHKSVFKSLCPTWPRGKATTDLGIR